MNRFVKKNKEESLAILREYLTTEQSKMPFAENMGLTVIGLRVN
jgi:hypothetical protein